VVLGIIMVLVLRSKIEYWGPGVPGNDVNQTWFLSKTQQPASWAWFAGDGTEPHGGGGANNGVELLVVGIEGSVACC
jgi:hypothetical protein